MAVPDARLKPYTYKSQAYQIRNCASDRGVRIRVVAPNWLHNRQPWVQDDDSWPECRRPWPGKVGGMTYDPIYQVPLKR